MIAGVATALGGGAIAAAKPLPVTTAPLKTVEVGSATLGYRVVGDASKPPIVLVPGYAVTAAEWDPAFIGAMARTRRVIVFDNRGMGNSAGPVSDLSVGRMARDLAGLVRALGLKRPDVLGWSMGGYIAQVYALSEPTHVRRLVLASTDPGSERATPPSAEVLAVLEDPDATAQTLNTVLFPADEQAAGNAWLARISASPHLTAADFSTPGNVVSAQATASGQDWLGRGDGTYARLPRLRPRTLVAYGAEDVVVPPANAKLLTSRIPHVTSHRFAGAGHAFLFQRPVEVAAVFARFLK